MSLNFCFEISDSYKLSDSLDMSDMKKNNKISRWLGHELPAFPLRSLDFGGQKGIAASNRIFWSCCREFGRLTSGEDFFSSLTETRWKQPNFAAPEFMFLCINRRQTDLKGRHGFILFYFVYMWRTLPPSQLQTVQWGGFFHQVINTCRC